MRKTVTKTGMAVWVALGWMIGAFSWSQVLAEEGTVGQNQGAGMTNNSGQNEQGMGPAGGWGGQGWRGMGPGPGMANGPQDGRGMGSGRMGRPHGGMGFAWPKHPEVLKNCLTVAKRQLAITPAQEAVWASYAKTLTDQNETKATLLNEMGNQTSSDPIAMETHRIAVMERGLAGKKAVLEAYKALHAQLDNFQKGIVGPPQAAPCRH